MTQLGVTAERVAAVCIGIPCFGEYPELDAAVSARTRQLFPNGAVRCENDCYVGFAGAFGLKAGINVVAGTGSHRLWRRRGRACRPQRRMAP